MQRLFVKIFIWFWLAMTLIGAILVTLALTTNHQQAFINRQKNQLIEIGLKLRKTYESKGAAALTEAIIYHQKKAGIRLALVHVDTKALGRNPLSPRLREFARKAMINNLMSPLFKKTGPKRPGDFQSFALPLDDHFVLLAEMPKPSMLELFLDPQALILRLGITFLVAGAICFLLARSITAPIMRIRQATQKFASGQLSTRVSPILAEKKGELADLANDFDMMAERIEQLLESQHRLLRDISHELRSPLARLNIALELARHKPLRREAALDRIEKESLRLNELIGQLLNITRLEEQRQPPERTMISIGGLLAKVVGDANYEAQTRGCEVRLTGGADLLIEGTEELLHRAFENIIRNALLYSPEKTNVLVNISHDSTRETVMITVEDSGPGVPEAALSELFRPFYRVSESRDRLSGGTGVGLAIAKRAVLLHEGRIEAQNSPDGGLIIQVELPCLN